MTTKPQQPSIAIIGAGPAGLTAANVLRRHGRQFSVFEADRSVTSRDQGGTLDLHPAEGQLALEKAGLLDAFLAIARHEDQEQRIVDHASGALVREDIPGPGTGDRPEIDRIALRELLLKPLAASAVRWNARIDAVIARPDGRYHLATRDGAIGPFDLVIGADGAWSATRAALTEVGPGYTGIAFVELWLGDVDRSHPANAKLVGHGSMFSLHDGAGLVAQRNGNATIRVYAAFRTRPEDGDRPDRTLAGITKTELLTRFKGWAPSLLSLIVDAERIVAVRPIVSLPPGSAWPHRDGLTLVGDAAHVMPPLGAGVNLAMLGAAELAEALVGGIDWRQAVRDHERVMLERAAVIAEQCRTGFAEMFGSEGAQAVVAGHDARRKAALRTSP